MSKRQNSVSTCCCPQPHNESFTSLVDTQTAGSERTAWYCGVNTTLLAYRAILVALELCLRICFGLTSFIDTESFHQAKHPFGHMKLSLLYIVFKNELRIGQSSLWVVFSQLRSKNIKWFLAPWFFVEIKSAVCTVPRHVCLCWAATVCLNTVDKPRYDWLLLSVILWVWISKCSYNPLLISHRWISATKAALSAWSNGKNG